MAGNNMEMKAHEGTYGGFLTMMKFGTAASLLVGAIVILLIAH